jgi:tetrahydromethanopterin S-methyltransferase subunit H
MFVFKKEQKSFDFSGITIGGYPGENPTVLVGGLFFKGQAIVESTKHGLFDKRIAKEWLDIGISMAERTGHPLIVETYGRSVVAMERHLSWLVDNFDGPFMFESPNESARKRAIEFCDEVGLTDKAIYNSVNLSMYEDERTVLRESRLDKAVLLGWSPKASSLEERMEVIEGMVADAKTLGIEKFLVDPGTMPVGAGYGLELRTTIAVKSQMGLPTCLAPHNAPAAWKFIREENLDSEEIISSSVIASVVAAQLFATDCIMYGSLRRSREVFAAVALTQNAITASVEEANQVLGAKKHLFEPKASE